MRGSRALLFLLSVWHPGVYAADPQMHVIGTPPPGTNVMAPAAPAPPRASPSAELYFYKNAEGSLVVVDSLDSVPKKFRLSAKKLRR